MRKFFVDYYNEERSCGDGCCSDSWTSGDLSENGKHISTKEEMRWLDDEDDARQHANDWIQSEFDLKAGEYELVIDF